MSAKALLENSALNKGNNNYKQGKGMARYNRRLFYRDVIDKYAFYGITCRTVLDLDHFGMSWDELADLFTAD